VAAQPLFGARQRVVLLALFLGAFVLRLDGLTRPPLDFAPTRQYYSALIARGLDLGGAEDLPVWKRRIVDEINEELPRYEPPLMEFAAAASYRLTGAERLWIPRLFASLLWLLGGLFLYQLARRLTSTGGALFSLVAYLFSPFAIFASRSFQPDALMVMLLLASVLAIVRYQERPSRRRLVTAAAVSAAALLVKPGIPAPFLYVVFLSLSISRLGLRRAATDVRLPAFVGLSALPMLAYFLYGRYIGGFVSADIGDWVIPGLLVESGFWRGWLYYQVPGLLGSPLDSGKLLVKALAYALLLAGLLGIVRVRPGRPRALLLGLWGGYFCFGVIFTWHIHTHQYYSLPLVPILALSLGPIVSALARRAEHFHALVRLALALALVAAVSLATWKVHLRLTDPSYQKQVLIYREIGSSAHHTARALFLDPYYGNALSYHGWLFGRFWAAPAQVGPGASATRTLPQFQQAVATPPARTYFIVTNLSDLHADPRLHTFLEHSFTTVRETPDYLIFDLRRPRTRAS
jgi:4-amino-4-deoxy-L-arabinose transferase-like glycosyltransferase